MLAALFDRSRVTPATTAELADATGLSEWAIRRDIALGELAATRRRARARSPYRISVDEARRYLRQQGFLPPSAVA